MPYLGKSECHQCGREVDVSENRSGMAYYRCAPCGVKVQQTSQRGHRMHLEKIRRFEDPDDATPQPEPARHAPGESPGITEPQPAAKTPQKPAKRGNGTGFFFSGNK